MLKIICKLKNEKRQKICKQIKANKQKIYLKNIKNHIHKKIQKQKKIKITRSKIVTLINYKQSHHKNKKTKD